MRKDQHIEEASIKTGQTFYNDLCLTCNHVRICMDRKDRQRPIWFCEEFDDYIPVEEQLSVDPRFQTMVSTKEDDSSQLKGLCMNCESRHTCGYLKPNGGIWHCEEYK